MTKPSISQSQKRYQESVSALFSKNTSDMNHCLFLKSSSDTGVILNGGRNGSRFAPQSLLATFRKFSQDHDIKEVSFSEVEVANQELEEKDFGAAQTVEAGKIKNELSRFRGSIWQIGGGHDHIYPLLVALSPNYKKVIVINIDAHADTRTDSTHHSGTPFRQFSEMFSGEFHLFQFGLHPFANSFSTLSPLEKGKTYELFKTEMNPAKVGGIFDQIKSLIDADTAVVFSLDADAMNGYEVPGVSAVNPDGFSRKELLSLWKHYRDLPLKHAPIAGVYELNPLYDTLASISMRTIASFIFEGFRKK